jgi:mannose-1-phosphate guanylyltransferase
MLHAVIMAGGAGSRFWPESRDLAPKQLLALAGGRSMLQATVDRLRELAPSDRVTIATRASLAEAIAKQLPELPAEAILAEPCQRDTAPCIGLAAMRIAHDDPDATLVVLPADHVISPESEFVRAVRAAVKLVDSKPGRIVTFGIRPSYPAESFGYIERGAPLAELSPGEPKAFQAVRFREKPKAEIARQYLEAGTFYWNSGIFIWKARTILDALAERQPEMFEHLKQITAAVGTPNYSQMLEREFAAIKGISVDYAVMEHARDVVMIEAPFSWDDVGSWQALARLHGTDADGNTVVGCHLGVNTSGTIVRGPADHLIVTLGLKDCLVVHTPDATLVANKHDEEAIREVVKILREKGMKEFL